MTDQLPGRTPPWMTGVWVSPGRLPAQSPAAPAEPVRIGDAERDEALDALGEHFAAGRLNREEFDERSEQAMAARFDADLAVLFKDLPKAPKEQQAAQQVVVRRQRPAASPAVTVAVLTLVPLLILAVTASIALHGPVLVAPLVWLLVLSGMGRRRFHR